MTLRLQFGSSRIVNESDLRFVLRTCTNLIHTTCESVKIKGVIDAIGLDGLVLRQLVRYCGNVEMVQRSCLLVSELFAFCCAFITSDLVLNTNDSQFDDSNVARCNELLNTIHPLLDVLLQDSYLNLPAGCDINAQAATTLLVICEIYESIDPLKMPCSLFDALGTRPTIQLLVDLIYAGQQR